MFELSVHLFIFFLVPFYIAECNESISSTDSNYRKKYSAKWLERKRKNQEGTLFRYSYEDKVQAQTIVYKASTQRRIEILNLLQKSNNEEESTTYMNTIDNKDRSKPVTISPEILTTIHEGNMGFMKL